LEIIYTKPHTALGRLYPDTTQGRLKAYNTINRLRIIHEYYMANPGCYIHDAVTSIPEKRAMVYKYRQIFTECKNAIESIIDLRYYDRGIGPAHNRAGDTRIHVDEN